MLCLVLFQRWSATLALPDARALGPTHGNSPRPRDLLLFDTDAALVTSDSIAPLPVLHKLGHLVSLIFFRYQFEFVMVMAILDIFVRYTVLSIGMFILVALASFAPRKTVLASFPYAFTFLALCLLLQVRVCVSVCAIERVCVDAR